MRRSIAGAGVAVGALTLGLLGAVPAQAVPAYTYTITITSVGGGAIPGVYVSIDDYAASGQTDAAGSFTATLAAGTHTLDVENPMTYADITSTFTVAGNASSTVTIAGAQLITGTVTDPAGTALPGIDVYASKTSGSGSDSTTTDASGRYVAVVPAGSYRVELDDYDSALGDYARGPLYYPAAYSSAGAGTVVVAAGKDTALSTVKLARNGTISGKVTFLGKPVAKAYVYVKGTNGAVDYPQTDANGAYQALVPPGSYAASVDAPSGTTALTTYSGNTVREPDAARTTVTDGGSASSSIALVASAVVTGKVVDKNGKAAKGVHVSLSNTNRAGSAYVTTDANGRYTASGLATGPVLVDVPVGTSAATTTVSAVQGRTVTAKTLSTKAPTGAVSVKATTSTGKAGKGLPVWILDSKKHAIMKITAPSSGKVKFLRVPAGTYYVTIGGTNVAKKVKVGTKTVSAGTLKSPKLTTVKGKLTTSKGAAATSASVYLVDKYGAVAASGKTSSKGAYSFKHVVSGTYYLEFGVPSSDKTDSPLTAKVTVKKGKTLTKNARLGKAGTIQGLVRSSKGKAVAGMYAYADGYGSTSAAGRYVLTGNTPGKQVVWISDAYVGGYHNTRVTVTVKAGKTVTAPTATVS